MTYQGHLESAGAGFTGNAEFVPTLWNTSSGGSVVASNSPISVIVGVSNGFFVLPLDFGANFPGPERWLQLEVRTALEPFTLLSPRQPLTATPYALTASNLTGSLPAAQLSGALPSANLSGTYSSAVSLNNAANTFTGNGVGLTALNASELTSGVVPNGRLSGEYGNRVALSNPGNSFSGSGAGLTSLDASQLTSGVVPPAALASVWKITGNSGTTPGTHFLGTTDNQPLELRINNQRVWRAEPASTAPNIIAGSSGNAVTNDCRGCAVLSGGGTSGAANIVGDETFPVTSSVIVGGTANRISDDNAFIGAGAANLVEARFSAIGGGIRNRCDGIGRYSFIGGGQTNYVDSEFCFIGGGTNNQIETFSHFSAVAGGRDNLIDAFATNSAIGGGWSNVVDTSASFGTIPGGAFNLVDGKYGFAAGHRAKVRHQGAYVWADSTEADFASTANNQFLIRAGGGVGINVPRPRGELHVGSSADVAPLNGAGQAIIIENGAENGRAAFLALAGPGPSTSSNRVELELEANENERRAIIGTTSNHEIQFRQNNGTRMVIWTNGFVGIGRNDPSNRLMVVNARCDGSTWINASDRNLKQHFQSVNSREVLAKVAALPVQTWTYKDQPDQKHLGPVAQDFHAAFGLGSDDKSIATVDESGVALAAIQGLNEKVEEQRAELEARDNRIADLERRLAALERLLTSR